MELMDRAKKYAKALADNPGGEFRNMAQAASNMAAENVSGPVDLLASGLRKAGLAIPANHLGGSEWMKQAGLIQEVPAGGSRMIGETLGLVAPIAAASRMIPRKLK